MLNPEPRTPNPVRPAGVSSAFCPLPSALRQAFTLTELMVVIAILALVAAMAVPAMGPMFRSNHTAAAIGTVESFLVTAQAAARAQGTPVALRIERAFKASPEGFMLNTAGQTSLQAGITSPNLLCNNFAPAWLDHQQIRIVNFSPSNQDAFVADLQSRPTALPTDVWLAPGELPASLVENDLWFSPDAGVRYNHFDTFFIVFDAMGELSSRPATACGYVDRSLPTYSAGPGTRFPFVARPPSIPPAGNSPRSLRLYDRRKWDAISPTDGIARRSFLDREGIPLHINRVTGAAVGGKR